MDFENDNVERINDIEQTTYIVPEILNPGETYYWRCRAFIAGDTTEWSNPWSFTMSGVGVEEVLTDNNISIFPNPSNGELYVDLNISSKVYINLSISNLLLSSKM